MNTTTEPNVPLPAGATTDGWHSITNDGLPSRSLEWSRHDTGTAGVSVDGWQDATGAYSKGVSVYGIEGKAVTAVEARDLAAALIEAADELDKLDGAEGTVR